MDKKINRHIFSILKKPIIRFSSFAVILSILLSIVIYFRESELTDEISLSYVLLWQLIIWSPWIIVFALIVKHKNWLKSYQYKNVLIFLTGIVWLLIHFVWFVFISSNFSPYLDKPATGYGVYPYFFIFWTFLDIIILSATHFFTIYPTNDTSHSSTIYPTNDTSHSSESKHLKIELTRGGEKVFCNPQDIQWLSSDNYYTNLQTIYGKFIMRNTLKFYYEQLQSHGFIQVHRSTVVNIQFVNGLIKSDKKLFVVMKDGTKQAVSRKNTTIIKEKFKSLTM